MSQWRLSLMRHGSATNLAQTSKDFDRVLTPAGEREVLAAAKKYQAAYAGPDKILTSPSVRTTQSAEIVRAQLALPLDALESVAAIYDANLQTLIHLVHAQHHDHRHLFLVGHNPGMEELVHYFSGVRQRSIAFSPATIVTLQFDVSWAGMDEALARVEFTC